MSFDFRKIISKILKVKISPKWSKYVNNFMVQGRVDYLHICSILGIFSLSKFLKLFFENQNLINLVDPKKNVSKCSKSCDSAILLQQNDRHIDATQANVPIGQQATIKSYNVRQPDF